jgi:hypothetical protein
MLGGWKQTIKNSMKVYHQGIIVIDDITNINKREVKRDENKCQAICKNGKPCVHLPKEFEIFCKRHLKIKNRI